MTAAYLQLNFMHYFAATTSLRNISADQLRVILMDNGFMIHGTEAEIRQHAVERIPKCYSDEKIIKERLKWALEWPVSKVHGTWGSPHRKQLMCTICGNTIPAKRSTFCSGWCADFFLLHFSWGFITPHILRRDKWKCHDCGKEAVPKYGNDGLPWTDPYCWFDKAGNQVTRSEFQHQGSSDGCRHEPNPQYAGQLDIHHEVPLHCGGTNDHDNLITLCNSCHKARHKAEKAAIKAQHAKIKQAAAVVAQARRAKQNPSLDRFLEVP